MPASHTYFMTGALGCIGAWIVKALVERGDHPVAFDRSTDRRRLDAIMAPADLERVTFVTGDITSETDVRGAVQASGADRLIHLAGLQVPGCRQHPTAGARVNVVGTLNVFEAARAAGISRVVYASSAAVFGLADEAVDETVAPFPLTHYGVFKQANEGNARVYFHDCGLSSIGLRPFTVYGVGRDAGLTSDPTRAIKSALVGRSFQIRFSGTSDFLHAADCAAAFIACADRGPDGAHVFNIHGETRQVADVVALIDGLLPPTARGLVSFSGPPIPMPPALDDAALRAAIPDLPRTGLPAGIQDTIARFTALRDEGRLDLSDLGT